jgi:hypothetical protein
MPMLRSWIVGQIASFRDCWVFRKRIAEWARCSIRTVQRAITQARSLGLLGVARAKPNEVPPGASHAFACGWSHRWTIGWGKAAAQVKRMVTAARLAWMTRRTVAKPVASGNVEATAPPPKRWTADELDAELERLTTRA